MKNLFILLAVLTVPYILFAQEIDIEWGETNDKDIALIIKIIGQDANGDIYAVSSNQKKVFLEVYGTDLNRKKKVEIQLPEVNGKKVAYENVFMGNDKLILFASQNVSKVNAIYSYNLSTSGKVTRRKKILDIPIEKKKRSGDIIFHQEKDSDQLLVGMFVPQKKEKRQLAEFKLFDENIEAISEVKTRFAYADNEDDQINFLNAKYDKEGNIYVLTSSAEKQGKVKTLEYTLTRLSKDGEKKKKVLGSSDKPIEKMDFSIAENGIINIFGFYVLKTKARAKGIEGAFIQKLNSASMDSEFKKVIEFTYDHKKLFLKDKQAKKDKAMPVDFLPLYYDENEDGSFTMIAERRLTTVSQNTQTGRSSTSYLYQDIMILKIDAAGKVDFIEDVDKRQAFSYTTQGIGFGFITYTSNYIPPHVDNRPYMSFMPITTKDGKTIFIYNDNPKNIGVDTEKRKVLANMRKGLPMMATIDKNGKKEVEVIFGAKDTETILRPTIYLKISDNEFIIYGSNRKKDKLGKLTVK